MVDKFIIGETEAPNAPPFEWTGQSALTFYWQGCYNALTQAC